MRIKNILTNEATVEKNQIQELKTATLLTTVFVVLVLLSTIIATKVTFLFGLSASAGIILYPITFMVKDMLQKKAGRKAARRAIWLSAGAMLFASIIFYIVSWLPADSHWEHQTAFDVILTPVLRLTIASIIAGVISELIDTSIFSYVFNKGYQIGASIVSNFIGIIIDSVLFTAIAFIGVVPTSILFGIFITNTLIKLAVSIFGAPSIFLVKRTTLEEI